MWDARGHIVQCELAAAFLNRAVYASDQGLLEILLTALIEASSTTVATRLPLEIGQLRQSLAAEGYQLPVVGYKSVDGIQPSEVTLYFGIQRLYGNVSALPDLIRLLSQTTKYYGRSNEQSTEHAIQRAIEYAERDSAKALDAFEYAYFHSAVHDNHTVAAASLLGAAGVHHQSGEVRFAQSLLERAWHVHGATADGTVAGWVAGGYATICVNLGQWTAAADWFDAGASRARTAGDSDLTVQLLLGQAMSLLATADPAGYEAAVSSAKTAARQHSVELLQQVISFDSDVRIGNSLDTSTRTTRAAPIPQAGSGTASDWVSKLALGAGALAAGMAAWAVVDKLASKGATAQFHAAKEASAQVGNITFDLKIDAGGHAQVTKSDAKTSQTIKGNVNAPVSAISGDHNSQQVQYNQYLSDRTENGALDTDLARLLAELHDTGLRELQLDTDNKESFGKHMTVVADELSKVPNKRNASRLRLAWVQVIAMAQDVATVVSAAAAVAKAAGLPM